MIESQALAIYAMTVGLGKFFMHKATTFAYKSIGWEID